MVPYTMSPNFPRILPALLLAAALALSGCQSTEEKADGYYQSALQLIEAGNVDGALVELRNVFQYNGFHKEGRKLYADTQLARGEVAEAYGQYLRLIEQYPDTVEVRQTLAEIAMTHGDWAEVERHGGEAIRLAPDQPRSRALQATLDYRKAAIDRDEAGKARAADAARALQAELPDNPVLRRIVIDSLINGPTPQDAMPEIDKALASEPLALEFHTMKLQLLVKQQDIAGTGAHLQAMVGVFPDNLEVRRALITWFLSQKDADGAEAFLRKLAGDDTAPPEGHATVVQLLQATKGPEAAMAELARLITANQGQPNADIYTALRAALVYEGGDRDAAITTVETVLQTAEPSDQTRRIKIMLAQMLLGTGNQVGARARVEEVLIEDATNTDALKLRAAWLIQEDKPGEAIVDLRTALSQSPRDTAILTLMAEAHERDGSLDLAGERLAAAVEVSNSAPDESLRYAAFLRRQGRGPVAETVLTDARKANPANLDVLRQLADLKLAAQDFAGAEAILAALRQIATPEAARAATALQTALLLAQNRTEESLALLQSQIDTAAGGDNRAMAMLLETQVRGGKSAEARQALDAAIAKTPADPQLQLMSATLYAVTGDTGKSEETLRAIITADPAAEAPVRVLYSLLISAGRAADADSLLDRALTAQPKSDTLRFIKAGALERAGDIDGATAIYEVLYAENSSNLVVANNLASLITTYRDDPESLERAFVIARRLRGTEVPALQDTYGWIEYRRGNLDEALRYLEPAAKGLPDDPLAQFHLGMAYVGLNRNNEARTSLTRALELAANSPLPQFQTARDALAGLKQAPAP